MNMTCDMGHKATDKCDLLLSVSTCIQSHIPFHASLNVLSDNLPGDAETTYCFPATSVLVPKVHTGDARFKSRRGYQAISDKEVCGSCPWSEPGIRFL
jgi:hypothetical protein